MTDCATKAMACRMAFRTSSGPSPRCSAVSADALIAPTLVRAHHQRCEDGQDLDSASMCAEVASAILTEDDRDTQRGVGRHEHLFGTSSGDRDVVVAQEPLGGGDVAYGHRVGHERRKGRWTLAGQ